MALGKLWAGRAFGTSIGNLFVRLTGEDDNLTGQVHLNEVGVGVVVYDVSGSFDGVRLELSGETETEIEGVSFGRLSAHADLNARGELEGEWSTDVGSAGTFFLVRNDKPDARDLDAQQAQQLHTARHVFSAIGVDRAEIIAFAEGLQQKFANGRVVVTVLAGTEQSRYLDDFRDHEFSAQRAEVIKVHVQEPEGNGINKVATVEFGPQINFAMTQGSDEAWVLGELEKLKRDLHHLQRSYSTNFNIAGIGIKEALLVGAIIYLPTLDSLRDRAILMVSVIVLAGIVGWLHDKHLPHAAIYLGKRPEGTLSRLLPAIVSWVISVSAGVAAALIAGLLHGWLTWPVA